MPSKATSKRADITTQHHCTLQLYTNAIFPLVNCNTRLLIHDDDDDVTRISLIILLVWVVTGLLMTVIAGTISPLVTAPAHVHSRHWSALRWEMIVQDMDGRRPGVIARRRTIEVAIAGSALVAGMPLCFCRRQHLLVLVLLLLLELTLLLLKVLISPLSIELFGRFVAW